MNTTHTNFIAQMVIVTITFAICIQGKAETVTYDLNVHHTTVNFTGQDRPAMAINGQIPAPTLRFKQGDTAVINVHNKMNVPTSIHWHGLLLPNIQDGVPYLTSLPIRPHSTHTFTFPLIQSGTYWYHSHTGLQEQSGLYGSIVIDPPDPNPAHTADHDYVLLLSDWTDENPHEVLRTLKRGSEYYAFKKGATQSLAGALQNGALTSVIHQGMMRMPPMDISDVAYDAFLSNGKPETQLEARPSQTIRVRIINGSASTYFYINSASGPMHIIAADGIDVEPVQVNRLLIAVAETYDVLITLPDDHRTYELRATAQDGSGHTSTYIGPTNSPCVQANNIPRPNPYTSHHTQSHTHPTRPPAPYNLLRSSKPTTLPTERHWREINLTATGDMNRYIWAFNDKTLTESDKILIRRGENVRIILNNQTMMHHPIHLHGHFFRLINEQNEYAPLKHTVDLPPMGRQVLEFAATEDKDWFIHCHVLYHMKAGMARVLSYEGSTVSPEIAAARKDPANPMGKDPHYLFGSTTILSNMTSAELTLTNTRHTIAAHWQAPYDSEGDDSYEATVTLDRHIDRFASLYIGADSSEEQSTRAVAGFRYLLPMNIKASAWIDSDAEVRLSTEYELQLTDHLHVYTEAEYDTDSEWESAVGANYLINRSVSLTAQHHSEYGTGVGLKFEF